MTTYGDPSPLVEALGTDAPARRTSYPRQVVVVDVAAAARCGLSLLLLLGAVSLVVFVSWQQFAGRSIALGVDGSDGTLTTPLSERQSTHASGAGEAGSPASAPSGDGATRLDGTQVALATSAVTLAVGLGTGRHILRRLRQCLSRRGWADPEPHQNPGDVLPSEDDRPDVEQATAPEVAAPEVEESRPPRPVTTRAATGSMQRVVAPAASAHTRLATASSSSRARRHENAIWVDPFALTRRAPYHSRARLQWNEHDVACRTLDLSTLEITCAFPLELRSTLPPLGATATVTLLLRGALARLDALVAWTSVRDGEVHVLLQLNRLDSAHRRLMTAALLTRTPA